jgi:hypothetical protein
MKKAEEIVPGVGDDGLTSFFKTKPNRFASKLK